LEQGALHSMVFWGPPGVGKTTLAQLLAKVSDAHFETVSAVLAGVNFPMLLQSEEIRGFTDVHRAADRLLALTLPTLVKAVPVTSDPSDDF